MADSMDAMMRLARDMPAEELPAFVGALAQAQAVALARLTTARAPSHEGSGLDRNLSAKETARRLGVSLPYLYKHAKEYPFAVRFGRRVVFSARGIESWLRSGRPA